MRTTFQPKDLMGGPEAVAGSDIETKSMVGRSGGCESAFNGT